MNNLTHKHIASMGARLDLDYSNLTIESTLLDPLTEVWMIQKQVFIVPVCVPTCVHVGGFRREREKREGRREGEKRGGKRGRKGKREEERRKEGREEGKKEEIRKKKILLETEISALIYCPGKCLYLVPNSGS